MTTKKDTVIVHAGRHPEDNHGAVNPPVYRVSTVLSDSMAELKRRNADKFQGMTYGRYGTPTTAALEEAVAAVEGGGQCIAVGSGLAAITATLTALLRSGDHLLMTDSAYFPTRNFCDTVLSGLGIETTYYDPRIGGGIRALMRPTTRLVFTEAPGSLTFEMQDIPAIAEAAHGHGALVAMDNTWGLLTFQPFTKGVDVSIQAATKYIVGHSDAMLGTITTQDEALWRRIKTSCALFGYAAGSEETYLGLRGLRTLAVRLRHHFEAGLKVARWLEARPEVRRVLHPALPGDPGHDLWSRDFHGGCGLFGVELIPTSEAAVTHMLDGYRLFKLGYSWGGFESLVIPTTGSIQRTAVPWTAAGPTLRYHVGLEDPDDLIQDLDDGLSRLAGHH
jgi:cystathionine beta-lyase